MYTWTKYRSYRGCAHFGILHKLISIITPRSNTYGRLRGSRCFARVCLGIDLNEETQLHAPPCNAISTCRHSHLLACPSCAFRVRKPSSQHSSFEVSSPGVGSQDLENVPTEGQAAALCSLSRLFAVARDSDRGLDACKGPIMASPCH